MNANTIHGCKVDVFIICNVCIATSLVDDSSICCGTSFTGKRKFPILCACNKVFVQHRAIKQACP